MPDGGRAGGLFAFMLLLSSPSAHAQLPEQITIEWKDDAACPRPLRLSLESEVARLLGPSAQQAEPAEFEARVERSGSSGSSDSTRLPYRLSLSVRSETHRAERQMELASCAEAQDAAALLIATAIDPDAATRAPTPKPSSPEAPEDVTPREPPVVPHAWSLVARALFDSNALPGPAAGPALGVLLQRARLRVWGEARYLVARRASEPDKLTPGSRIGADVDLFSVLAGGAYVWPLGSWVIGPAAELELGALRARGMGGSSVASALHQAAPWGALDLGGVAGYAVHRRVGLELSLYAGLPLSQPRLALRDEKPFYTTSSVTMRVAVGVRVSLGSL